MAQSKHRAIRAAVAALLTADTPLAGGRVFQNRAYDLAEGIADQVHVNFAGSEPERVAIKGAPISWETELEIVVKARAQGGITADDAADALWVEIYARVMAAQALGGLAAGLDPGAVDIDSAEADTGVCRLNWRLTVLHDTDNHSIEA